MLNEAHRRGYTAIKVISSYLNLQFMFYIVAGNVLLATFLFLLQYIV